ncbi:MAG: hypothetical protein NUW24_13490 [Anaerolineae bacterium]|jgi:hypothetical protein|nr:hypothetical protein [Anaerolineae bacterium]MDH7475588.1 hypothetical protein [Anaerolineae bacterium]
MDLREKVTEAMGGLESLVAKIPGYSGYKAKETRREADKLLREQLARSFDEQRRHLLELQKQLVSSGQIALLDDMDSAAVKLQTLIDRIRTATYGYAGFFDAVKIKEDQLDALYEFDNALVEQVGNVEAAIERVGAALTAQEGVAEAIADLTRVVRDINDLFSRRQDAILQL